MANKAPFSGSGIPVREAVASRWRRLYRVAYSWCHDADMACDLVQETLARALRSREELPNDRVLDVWLFRIMTNCWRDHFRRTRDMVDIEDVELPGGVDPGEAHDATRVLGRVRTAVGGLNEGQRQVFTLVAVEGMTYEEVAMVLDIPVGTVMSRLSRAREFLKHQLRDLDPGARESGTRLWRVK